MKKIPVLTLVSLFIVAAQFRAAGQSGLLMAKLTGTVQTQTLLSPTDGRIHTTRLTSASIFTQFQVSSTDYELVVATGSGTSLELVPKHTTSGLPTLPVIVFGNDSQTVIDTKVRTAAIVSSVTNGTALNLFQNLNGEALGSIRYTGTLNSPTITSVNFTMIGHGTDQSGGSGSALLNLKITSRGTFTPVP